MKNKNVKSIICILLIALFSLPSYAAISSSDGSAFITKNDFDITVNELSSRLTILETGISNKIDSQISSYLDRNGIWSSKKQETINKTFRFCDLQAANKNFVSSCVALGNPSYTIAEDVVIKKISKSGLIDMSAWWSISWSSCGGADPLGNFQDIAREGGGRGVISYGIRDKDNNFVLYASSPGILTHFPVQWRGTNGGLVLFNTSADISINKSQFFVKKGDELRFKIDLSWYGRVYGRNATNVYIVGYGTYLGPNNTPENSQAQVFLNFSAKVY